MLIHMAEDVIKKNGVTIIRPRPDLKWIEDPCENCGAESVINSCDADGRRHRHGRVHTVSDRLAALCRSCANSENAKWITKKGI